MAAAHGDGRPRRAQRPGAPGTDPTPRKLPQQQPTPVRAQEDTGTAPSERGNANDARLRADKPPHWGLTL